MLLKKLQNIMGNYILYFCCFIGGAVLAIVALALVRGNSKDTVEVDLEKEELIKQWEDQSKGYN